jgi:hypothetical protein
MKMGSADVRGRSLRPALNRSRSPLAAAAACLALLAGWTVPALAQGSATCTTTVTARVVALSTSITSNRLGAGLPDAMIYALAGDVEPTSGTEADWTKWTAGNVRLKSYKRPRPMVLRVDKGQCLQVQFRNLLSEAAPPVPPASNPSQSTTRTVGLHVQGLNWKSSRSDDGSWVGTNPQSTVTPGNGTTYTLYASELGEFLLYSIADAYSFVGGPPSSTSPPGPPGADGGQLQSGLFGAVIVEPADARFFRSQVNHEDLCLASKDSTWQNGKCSRPDPGKLPEIDYAARYPTGHPRAGLPILAMLDGQELVHSDLTAVITGPTGGRFPDSDATLPEFHEIAVSPDRLEPYREFTIIYHEMLNTTQAFSGVYYGTQLTNALESTSDTFAINYGMGGIGSEILANRLGVGPAAGCTDCKYEEFFLSSWTNGDPAMIVDHPADTGCGVPTGTNPADYTHYVCPQGSAQTKATLAYFPDDPSNVYHAYLRDHTKFRILHGGSDLHHLHHLHAHQWLHSPNSSSSHYLDSQAIGPGTGFTLETVYDGAGNKNLTVGDSIFHCHFYPHFAAGMWGLWRVHDTFEDGTELTSYPNGSPQPNSRALPDGEIVTGTATVALVPLPTRPMAPEPAPVRLVDNGLKVEVCTDRNFSDCISTTAATGDAGKFKNPGYPYFIAGIAGTRASHPPLDFALACSISGETCEHWHDTCGAGGGICQAIDGGLPRHIVARNGTAHAAALNPLDFSKEVTKADGVELPEDGTTIEKVAMAFHGTKEHTTTTPEGTAAEFRTNGKPAVSGAPYADPCIDIEGNVPAGMEKLSYWAVDFQTDATFNKEGWHYPQQRMTSLWGDVFDYMGLRGTTLRKPPEPFFFRANSNDCVHYVLANLVPKTFELDDFEVRTPTDILGQHIHLVKFDVTASDGAANGWNYEDGTLAPDEVVERINAFNKGSFQRTSGSGPLTPTMIKFFGADPDCAHGDQAAERCRCELTASNDVKGGRWCGAQATVQRWYVDPTLNDEGVDGTLRTVFTHDHFGPSTHQQMGLYAALVAEPTGSTWHNNESGTRMGDRKSTQNGVTIQDGGPTSWEAVIKGDKTDQSFREFLFAFQDSALIYRPVGVKPVAPHAAGCPPGAACGFCSNDHTKACLTEPSSPIYYEHVCAAVSMPIPDPKNAGAVIGHSELPPQCNYVVGVPANQNLFYANAAVSNTNGNIFSLAPGSSGLAALRRVGWDDTLPIDPPGKGIVVPQTTTKIRGVGALATANTTLQQVEPSNKITDSSADVQVGNSQGHPTQNTPSQPELITLNGATQNFSVNYRNEPIYPRIHSTSTAPGANDLSHVYQSLARTLPGAHPPVYTPLTPGVEPGDPFTPLLRAYPGDDVEIRIVVGAHQNPHNFHLNDGKWLFEPSNVGSGWRASETMGISEHFELLMKVPTDLKEARTTAASQVTPPATKPWTDFLYRPTAAKQGQAAGNWGLLRAYHQPQSDLFAIPGSTPPPETGVCPAALMKDDCGATDANGHKLVCYGVVATTAQDALGGTLFYNSKLGWMQPNAILYLTEADYNALKHGNAVAGYNTKQGLAEPLVLRAAAGDCVRVTLHNKLTTATTLGQGYSSGQVPANGVSPASRNVFIPSQTSHTVGLHPQLVAYNAAHSDGMNVGDNPVQTAAPGKSVTYFWYAGNIDYAAAEDQRHVPAELGAINLLPSDPVNHHPYSLFGALIIEPEGATWQTDPNSHTSATVTVGSHSFREFVLETQDDGVIFNQNGKQPGGGGFGAFNLRTEILNPFLTPNRSCDNDPVTGQPQVACTLSSQAICNGVKGGCGFTTDIPIQTPLFCATQGGQVRFRLLHPGGAVTNEVFELYGHSFAEEPYVTRSAHCQTPVTHTNVYASQVIDPDHNECPDGNLAVPGPSMSEWKGSRVGVGPLNHFDVVVASAGGANAVPGDYLYRTFPALHYAAGIWGIFRVTVGPPTAQYCPSMSNPQNN